MRGWALQSGNYLRRSMRKILIVLIILAAYNFAFSHSDMRQTPQPEPQPGKPIVIPTRYDEHRFIATPVTIDNASMSLLTDSAGQLFVYEDAITRFGLSTETDDGVELAVMPNFKPDAMIPAALGKGDPRLFIKPRSTGELGILRSKQDGILGQQWFAGRVWTFDYPNKKLLWRAANDLPAHDKD